MTDANHLSADAPALVRETHSGVVILLGDRAYKPAVAATDGYAWRPASRWAFGLTG